MPGIDGRPRSPIQPWGAFPGHEIYDIQSGLGRNFNFAMLDKVEKVVVRAKPAWPTGLDDGTILPTPGGYPPQMEFDPGQWAAIGIPSPEG